MVFDEGGHPPVVAPPGTRIGDDGGMPEYVLPRIPASAGALLRDGDDGILVLKPTYKGGWTVPGGQVEEGGETPWEACRREVAEETGLIVDSGRLVCVDFLRARPDHPGGVRFLFDCGEVAPVERDHIVLQEGEIGDHRWAEVDEALRLLSGPVSRRVGRALGATGTIYLEDGRPVVGVGD
ncbi:MAG: NUDIX hydrolase [Acidimicrobiales bacterium]